LLLQCEHNGHNNSWNNLYNKYKYGDLKEIQKKLELIYDDVWKVEICLIHPIITELIPSEEHDLSKKIYELINGYDELIAIIQDDENILLDEQMLLTFNITIEGIKLLILCAEQENLSELHDEQDKLVNNKMLRIFRKRKWRNLLLVMQERKFRMLTYNFNSSINC